MRTTIELPDELLKLAKSMAALEGVSLRQFLIDAVRFRIAPGKTKVRKHPPMIGDPAAAPLLPLTREQIDEAMFS